MTSRAIPSLLPHLRRALGGRHSALSDEQLLECFLVGRDELAFSALVYRHGPMVLGLCRRLLRDSGDAEDAFQATFLVLVRKARSISRPERLANWLYGVAHRTALKLRASRVRRQQREVPLVESAVEGDLAQLVWRDVRPVLDEELHRLPEKYRLAVVLCCLEGLSKRDAAARLGWPEGTLSTRLHEARQMLRSRLVRRGLTLTPAVLALALAEGSASAAVPAALAGSTVSSASLLCAGQAAALPAKILALTEGVLHAMLMSKLKSVAAFLAVAGMLLVGTGAALTGSRAASSQLRTESNDPAPAEKSPQKPAEKTPAVKEDPAPQKIRVGEEITWVIWSPDGKLFAGPDSRLGVVKVWDAATGKEVVAHSGLLKDGVFVGFTPDSKSLVLYSRSGRDKGDLIRFRAIRDGKLVKTITAGGEASVPRLAFSPDGRQLAALSAETGVVRLWDAQSGKVVREIRQEEKPANALGWSRDGKVLVIGGGEKNKGLRMVEAQTGKILWHTATTGVVWGIAFSPDGKTIAVGQDDRQIVLIGISTGKIVKIFSDACHHNHQPTFSPDGRRLLCTGMSLKGGKAVAEVRLWDVPTGKLLRAWSDNRTSAAFSPDGRTLYVLGKDGAIEAIPLSGQATRPGQKPVAGAG